jgi:hypothetical protein
LVKKERGLFLFIVMLSLAMISCGVFGNLLGGNNSNASENDLSNNNVVIATASTENAQSQFTDVQDNTDGQNSEMQSDGEDDENFDLPFPVVDDAFNIEEQYGNYRYQTNLSVEDASEFYRVEMQALGYEIAEDVYTGTGTIFSFERSDSIVTMNVIQNDQGSVTVNYAERNP